MNDLDELELATLKAAHRGYTPDAARGARVRSATLSAIAQRVTVPLDARGVLDEWSDAVHDGVDALRDVATVPRALATMLIMSGVGGGGYALGLRQGRLDALHPPSTVVIPPALSSATDVVSPPPTAPAPSVQHTPSGSRQVMLKGSDKPAPPELGVETNAEAPSDAVALELQTLRRVERAQRGQNPRLALALLDELEHSVPGGKLREERSAARTVAVCGLEPAASVAAARAAEFSARYPGSVHLARVRGACAVEVGDDERKLHPAETDPETGRSTL